MRPRARAVLVFLAFVAFSLPLSRAAGPDTHARRTLDGLGDTPVLVFLGDSRPHAGISPTLVADRLAHLGFSRVSARSFAEDGTDTLHHHDLVTHALLRARGRDAERAPGAPRNPRVIVVAVNPLGFDATRTNNRLDRLDPAATVSLLRAGAPVETVLDVGTMAVFPPYRRRPEIKRRAEILAEKAGFALAARQSALGLAFDPPPERRTYFAEPDGQAPFVVDRDWQGGFDLSREGYRERYAKLRLGEAHFALAEDMADRAREAGVALVFLEMPVAPSYRADFASLPVHAAWQRRMKDLAEARGAVWIEHADLFDDDRAFGDPGHMQRPLAERYSAILAEALARDPRVAAALARDPSVAAALGGT